MIRKFCRYVNLVNHEISAAILWTSDRSTTTLADARKNGADWKYILHLPLDCLRRVGFDFSLLSEVRDRLIEDELLQKPIIVINLGLKKFAESSEEPEVKSDLRPVTCKTCV